MADPALYSVTTQGVAIMCIQVLIVMNKINLNEYHYYMCYVFNRIRPEVIN